MILAHELTKSFGARRVLRGLDLAVEPGAITLMVGANGAGKTTTLRILAGLARADGGTVTICGHDLEKARGAALARMSFLPQAPRFHPRLTTGQTARFYGELRGRTRRDVDAGLDAWGVLEFADVPTGKLSGGLRQRLALAVFALADAPVLMLDEPGLSLDPQWRRSLQDFLVNEAERGRTILLATHLLGEWEGKADRCLLVEHGRSQGELPPDRIRDCFPRLERDAVPSV
ncbi:ABC transporter [Nibricoccus aquaticus]|uniref:ABC transporter n=1 Tax=Nibricoccus aquaticus TaxID=2576891 RepID=A0A290Q3A2_9BACT|nr:ABC transporter ATP-binding protein [Nibricoccus aquaticus]ATC63149.1 ABC transporter [Nibricoccus aquaticus]